MMARRPRTYSPRTDGGEVCKRNSRLYQQQRKQFKARCAAANTPCHICGGALGAIDYRAPAYTANAFEVDHIVPLALGGDPYSIHNWSAAHSACNRSRQAKQLTSSRQVGTAQVGPAPGGYSGRWVRADW